MNGVPATFKKRDYCRQRNARKFFVCKPRSSGFIYTRNLFLYGPNDNSPYFEPITDALIGEILIENARIRIEILTLKILKLSSYSQMAVKRSN